MSTEQGTRVVIVVDDHPSVCEALVSLLESVGHSAIGFNSAEEFLQSSTQITAACVITDIQMPGMGGLELVARMRQERPVVPIIVITARREPELLERARSLGVHSLYQKPLDDARLLTAVAECLAADGRKTPPEAL